MLVVIIITEMIEKCLYLCFEYDETLSFERISMFDSKFVFIFL